MCIGGITSSQSSSNLRFWKWRREDSKRIEYALKEIESQLQVEPFEVGESRDGNERVLISNPLTVIYEVFEKASVVVILTMKHHEYGSRPH